LFTHAVTLRSSTKPQRHHCYHPTTELLSTHAAIQKKIVIDEHGAPQEVIIPWAQFCEINEALGFDLDATEQAELREALGDSLARRREAFTPLAEL